MSFALKGHQMDKTETVVAIFEDHGAAESAVKKLAASGFEMKNLSVVGKGYRTEEKAIGFYNVGDRIKFWGARGAFWGGLWGLFFGGLFLAVPVVGHVVVLGYLASVLFGAVENAVVLGGLSALGGRSTDLASRRTANRLRNRRESRQFSGNGARDGRGSGRAKTILGTINPSRLDVHVGTKAIEPADLSSSRAAE